MSVLQGAGDVLCALFYAKGSSLQAFEAFSQIDLCVCVLCVVCACDVCMCVCMNVLGEWGGVHGIAWPDTSWINNAC